ncbi:MAG: hypothetical protein ABGW85_02605, partial [Sulfurimonas sp.]
VKEAVELTFTAEQKDRSDVMFFFLEAKKSPDYKITLLKKEAKELVYHHKKTTFHYLLFPLKSGKIAIDFDFTVKVASDEAIAQVYEGSRDNVKWIETDNTHIALRPLELEVKALPHDVDLVGEFEISSQIDKTTTDAYEGIHLKYFLKGLGFDEFNLELIPQNSSLNIFKDIIKHYNKATPNGYEIQQEYSYAILANKDFMIPSQTIHCFSPQKNKYYTLKTKEYQVHVKALNKELLLDKDEYPSEPFFFEKVQNFFLYVLIFLAGFISAKILHREKKKLTKSAFEDIYNTTDAKELLFLLTNKYQNQKEFYPFHHKLEDIVYNTKSTYKFQQIKKEIAKIIKGLKR